MKMNDLLPRGVSRQWMDFLSRQQEVRRAILFGSRARGDGGSRSDIDIAISAPRIGQREWLDITSFLQEGTDTLLSIDVIRLETASRALKKKIFEEGHVIYERD